MNTSDNIRLQPDSLEDGANSTASTENTTATSLNTSLNAETREQQQRDEGDSLSAKSSSHKDNYQQADFFLNDSSSDSADENRHNHGKDLNINVSTESIGFAQAFDQALQTKPAPNNEESEILSLYQETSAIYHDNNSQSEGGMPSSPPHADYIGTGVVSRSGSQIEKRGSVSTGSCQDTSEAVIGFTTNFNFSDTSTPAKNDSSDQDMSNESFLCLPNPTESTRLYTNRFEFSSNPHTQTNSNEDKDYFAPENLAKYMMFNHQLHITEELPNSNDGIVRSYQSNIFNNRRHSSSLTTDTSEIKIADKSALLSSELSMKEMAYPKKRPITNKSNSDVLQWAELDLEDEWPSDVENQILNSPILTRQINSQNKVGESFVANAGNKEPLDTNEHMNSVVVQNGLSLEKGEFDDNAPQWKQRLLNQRRQEEEEGKKLFKMFDPPTLHLGNYNSTSVDVNSNSDIEKALSGTTNINTLNNFLNAVNSVANKSSSSSKINYQLSSNSTKYKRGLHLIQEETYQNQDEGNNSVHQKIDRGNSTCMTTGNMTFETHSFVSAPSMNNDLFKDGKQVSPDSPFRILTSGQLNSRGRPQLSPLASERFPDSKPPTAKIILKKPEQQNIPPDSRLKIFGAYNTFTKDFLHRIVQSTGDSTTSSSSSHDGSQQRANMNNSTDFHEVKFSNSGNNAPKTYDFDTKDMDENISFLKGNRAETTQSDFMVAADQVMTGLINRPPLPSTNMGNQLNINVGCEDEDAYTEASVSSDLYLYSEAQNDIQGLREMKTSTLKDDDSGDTVENMNLLARFRSLSLSDPPNINTLETNGAYFSTLNSLASSKHSRSQSQSTSSIHTSSLGSKYRMRQFSDLNDSFKYQESASEARNGKEQLANGKSKGISFGTSSIRKELNPVNDSYNEAYFTKASGDANDNMTPFSLALPSNSKETKNINQLENSKGPRVVILPSKTPSRNIVNISPGEVSNIEACHEQGLRYDPKVKQWRKPSGELVNKEELADKPSLDDNLNKSILDDSITFDTTPEEDDAGNSASAGKQIQFNNKELQGNEDSFRDTNNLAGDNSKGFFIQNSDDFSGTDLEPSKLQNADTSCVGTFEFPPFPTMAFNEYGSSSSDESWNSDLNCKPKQGTTAVVNQLNQNNASQGVGSQRYFSGATSTTDSGGSRQGSVVVNSRMTRRKVSLYDYREPVPQQEIPLTQDYQAGRKMQNLRVDSMQDAHWTKVNEVLLSPSKSKLPFDRALSQASTMVGNANDQSAEYKEKEFCSSEENIMRTTNTEKNEVNITNILTNLEAISVFNTQRFRKTAEYIPFFHEYGTVNEIKENSVLKNYDDDYSNITERILNVNSHMKAVKKIDRLIHAQNPGKLEHNNDSLVGCDSLLNLTNTSNINTTFSSINQHLLNAFLKKRNYTDMDDESFALATEIVLRESSLDTIEQLDTLCPKLIKVDVSFNSIKSLAGLPVSVRELNAAKNELGPYLVLNMWKNLQYIDISGNNLVGLAGLEDLIHLREINAKNNKIKSIKAIEKLEGLLAINLDDNDLTSIDFKNTRYSRLKSASFCGNYIKMVKNLNKLPDLQELELTRNDILVISTSENHRPHEKLARLSLANNSLTEFDVSLYPNLNYLNLHGNLLESIDGFNPSMAFISLYLSSQSISDVSNISLGISDEKKRRPSTFTLPPNLNVQSLFLSNLHAFKILNANQPFTFVSYLDLSGCDISKLPDNFSQLFFNLRGLDLSFNSISELTPIFDLPHLTHLYLYSNSISSLKTVESILMNLEFLQVLDCRKNPLTKDLYSSIMSSPYIRTLSIKGKIEAYNESRTPERRKEWIKKDKCYRDALSRGTIFSSAYKNKVVWEGRKRYIKEIVKIVMKENSPLSWLDGQYVENNSMWKHYLKLVKNGFL
ncbi:hypothetical protein NADFUDRAFT_42872 [Nadsonia fulvescens var. elongata DSM 6958]|uniref:L domain-like protein n=1 Tax=Nadsonia fulvescens var. elongata DSM 6958 TaxID=857566 RepID=A0A1E3PGP5_9ASCO|nr:hypothetical protein NADFUDRAFT_42872 [Nadsonia fulvescens var. elongata DSM 6958]